MFCLRRAVRAAWRECGSIAGCVGGRDQQLFDAARDVGPDRVALEGPGQIAHTALGERHSETLAPEPVHSFANGRCVMAAVDRRERASAWSTSR